MKHVKLFIFILIALGITLGFVYKEYLDPSSLKIWLENLGNAAPFIFMVIYIIGTVFFLPGSVLTLLGGALFGPVLGTFINLTAATLGAMLSFLISRFLAANWVTKKAGGRLKQVITGVENEGWRFVAVTRLIPLFPFNLLNYTFGLTKINFTQYSITTFICMFPGALAYSYLGYIGKEAATGGEDLIQKAMLALALLTAVAFIPRLINRFKQTPNSHINIKTLKTRLDSGEDILLLDVRTASDYQGEQGHINESVLLPVEELENRINEIDEYKNKPIITICRTDRKSAKAASLLTQHGFTNVHVATMGMTDWIKNGYNTNQDLQDKK